MGYRHAVTLLRAAAATLLFVGVALGQVDLSEFQGESEHHGTLSQVRGLCMQAAVVAASEALDTCKPSAKDRSALKALAVAIQKDTCANAEDLPLEVERARELADNASLSLEQAIAKREEGKSVPTPTPAQQAQLVQLEKDVADKAAANNASAHKLVRAQRANQQVLAFNELLNRALVDSATWEDFIAFKADDKRQKACQAFASALYGKTDTGAEAKDPARVKADAMAEAAAAAAHASDILRKGSNLSTALSTAAGIIEKPGAPDAATATIMSALGADRETQGTQAVFTLNVASLFQPNQDARLKTSAAWRNLFLRASMPLESVDGENVSPAGQTSEATESAEALPPVEPNVTRFSFVVGTSLFDETDPRLETPQKCFARVVDYLPIASTDTAEERVKPLREAIFDGCAHEAAKAQRLAVRGALGLVTDEDQQKTNVELAALAIVWGPTPYLYFNGIYQHVFRPDVVDTVGAGVSLGTNASASASGVDAWGRITIDAFWLLSRVNDSWVMEGRLVPTAQFRMGDSVASLGVGPRLLGGDNDGVSLIATLAVTYDADVLINPLLTPLHPGPQ